MWFSNEICVSALCYPAPYIILLYIILLLYIIILYYIIIIYYTITLPIFYTFSAPNYQFLSPTILKVPIFDSLKMSIFDS